MKSKCELCLRDSGRYNDKLDCCKVRYVANMPETLRMERYTALAEQVGKEEAQKFVDRVNAERRRLRGMRDARKEAE